MAEDASHASGGVKQLIDEWEAKKRKEEEAKIVGTPLVWPHSGGGAQEGAGGAAAIATGDATQPSAAAGEAPAPPPAASAAAAVPEPPVVEKSVLPPAEAAAAAPSRLYQAIYMYSSVPGNAETEGNQRKLQSLLQQRHVAFTMVDGANADNRELRSKLWGISGKRAVYPQLFGQDGEEYKFFGDWAAIQAANEGAVEGGVDALFAELKKA